jgi:DNA-binding transcriptional LysR family regulator
MNYALDASLLGALRCFETAAHHLSFTQAAAATNLTQSAISQQIRSLEDRLGYPLFIRRGRGLVLTHKGNVLAKAVTECFADLSRTLQQLDLSHLPLNVNCLPSFALQWLMPRLTDFHRMHANCSVRLNAEFHILDFRSMLNAEIDVAIRYDPVEYDPALVQKLMPEYLVAVGTPEYLASHPSVTQGKLANDVVLLHDGAPWDGAPEFIEWHTWAKACMPQWTERLAGPQFNLASLSIAAALNHQGLAMGRIALIQDELRSGRLVKVSDSCIKAPASYVLLSRSPSEKRTALFASWLTQECRKFELSCIGRGGED